MRIKCTCCRTVYSDNIVLPEMYGYTNLCWGCYHDFRTKEDQNLTNKDTWNEYLELGPFELPAGEPFMTGNLVYRNPVPEKIYVSGPVSGSIILLLYGEDNG
jgi:hypothetical protein